MLKKILVCLSFGLVVAAALGLSIDLVYGEIEIVAAQDRKSADLAPNGGPQDRNLPLQVQCWQNGIKIIDEVELSGIRLSDLTEGDGIRLQGPNWKHGTVNIIPVNDASTCLVKPMR